MGIASFLSPESFWSALPRNSVTTTSSRGITGCIWDNASIAFSILEIASSINGSVFAGDRYKTLTTCFMQRIISRYVRSDVRVSSYQGRRIIFATGGGRGVDTTRNVFSASPQAKA